MSVADFIVPCVVYFIMLRRSTPEAQALLSTVSLTAGLGELQKLDGGESPAKAAEHHAIPFPLPPTAKAGIALALAVIMTVCSVIAIVLQLQTSVTDDWRCSDVA